MILGAHHWSTTCVTKVRIHGKGDLHCSGLRVAKSDLAQGHAACSICAVHFLWTAAALHSLAFQATGDQPGQSLTMLSRSCTSILSCMKGIVVAAIRHMASIFGMILACPFLVQASLVVGADIRLFCAGGS